MVNYISYEAFAEGGVRGRLDVYLELLLKRGVNVNQSAATSWGGDGADKLPSSVSDALRARAARVATDLAMRLQLVPGAAVMVLIALGGAETARNHGSFTWAIVGYAASLLFAAGAVFMDGDARWAARELAGIQVGRWPGPLAPPRSHVSDARAARAAWCAALHHSITEAPTAGRGGDTGEARSTKMDPPPDV